MFWGSNRCADAHCGSHHQPLAEQNYFGKLVYLELFKVMRSTLLQVTMGRQIGSRGGPPVDAPGPPLDLDISGSRSPNETSRVLIRIIFDALSNGPYAISPS